MLRGSSPYLAPGNLWRRRAQPLCHARAVLAVLHTLAAPVVQRRPPPPLRVPAAILAFVVVPHSQRLADARACTCAHVCVLLLLCVCVCARVQFVRERKHMHARTAMPTAQHLVFIIILVILHLAGSRPPCRRRRGSARFHLVIPARAGCCCRCGCRLGWPPRFPATCRGCRRCSGLGWSAWLPATATCCWCARTTAATAAAAATGAAHLCVPPLCLTAAGIAATVIMVIPPSAAVRRRRGGSNCGSSRRRGGR